MWYNEVDSSNSIVTPLQRWTAQSFLRSAESELGMSQGFAFGVFGSRKGGDHIPNTSPGFSTGCERLGLGAVGVSADPPPGVAPAVRVDNDDWCAVSFDDGTWYIGTWAWQYSNGATGHSTLQCKMDFVSGTPRHEQWKESSLNCDWHVTVAGKKAKFTGQCFEDWYP